MPNTPSGSSATPTVVLVEDYPAMRSLVRIILEDAGLAVVGEAASAEEAMPIVASMHPSLVVLDWHLGAGMSGFEVAPLFKVGANPPKVLMFTALYEAATAARIPAVDALLSKAEVTSLASVATRLLAA